MVIAIGVLAGLLFVLGLGLLVSAINLLPTDLGLVYLQGGITFITGAAIILAIALSTKHRRFRPSRRRSGKAARGVMTDQSAADGATSPAYTAPAAGMAASALGAASLASAVYGAPASGHDEAEHDPRTKAVLEAFERDLGAELAALPAQAWQEDDLQKTGEQQPPDMIPPEKRPDAEMAIAPDLAPYEQGNAEPLMFDLPPLPALAPQPDWSLPPPIVTTNAEPASPPPDVPGLLPDDDLETLAQEEAPLAPLETLEEVGSYESAGTRFTMYSDGSVVTSGPDGQKRHRTLEDLRAALAAQ
jgi:hypothetical protein